MFHEADVEDVLSDLLQNEYQRITDVLPAGYTANILQDIRSRACLSANKSLNCAKWETRKKLCDPEVLLYGQGNTYEEKIVATTNDYVCTSCTHPQVSERILVELLFSKSTEAANDEKMWRRYVNDVNAIPVNTFRIMIVRAYEQNWLTLQQALSIWERVDRYQAIRQALGNLIRRWKERKGCIVDNKLNINDEEFQEEFDVEFYKCKLIIQRDGKEKIINRQSRFGRLDLSKENEHFLFNDD